MSITHRLLALLCFLSSTQVYAFGVFFDPLYWQPTETIDWVLINDRNLPSQNIQYKTMTFNYHPGFRVGVEFKDYWNFDSKFYYTYYHTNISDTASGNLVSTFLGGKLVQNDLFFYQTGQIQFSINLKTFDWDLSKSICLGEDLNLRPFTGLRAGSIHQKIVSTFQGPISIIETVKNNFKGFGPKVGIEGSWTFYRRCGYAFSLVSDFSTSYLWGRWRLSDVTQESISRTLRAKEGRRNFGAFTIQGLLGIGMNYDCFSVKLAYEINDWFNQYQILDDGTGARCNDLILQGLSLRFSYNF